MVDITHKSNTLRVALAQAIVKVGKQDTIDAIENGTVPKGDVFSMSKAVGMLAVKNTPLILADCHPLPIEHTKIEYEINGLEIKVTCLVKTVYKTGVEVEAMHGASAVALNMYDMLKPIDKEVEIHHIKLLQKKGGKSDYNVKTFEHISAAIVVCSDTISKGTKEDKSGKILKEELESRFGVQVKNYSVISDDKELIQQKVDLYAKSEIDLLIFSGGTGLSNRDVTPDAVLPMLDREVPGIMEIARKYGQDRIPFAMLSRGVAGVRGSTLVLTLPGSSKAAKEYMDVLFPHIFHVFPVLKGERHD